MCQNFREFKAYIILQTLLTTNVHMYVRKHIHTCTMYMHTYTYTYTHIYKLYMVKPLRGHTFGFSRFFTQSWNFSLENYGLVDQQHKPCSMLPCIFLQITIFLSNRKSFSTWKFCCIWYTHKLYTYAYLHYTCVHKYHYVYVNHLQHAIVLLTLDNISPHNVTNTVPVVNYVTDKGSWILHITVSYIRVSVHT